MTEAQDLPIEELLDKSLGLVRSLSLQVRKTLSSPNGKLLVAVKQGSTMLNELRTSKLPPKAYYELYNSCFDTLSQLQGYFTEDHINHHLADVYEIVQYTATVIPRLYLIITVGTAFIATGDAPREDVLRDMLEMSRAVQSPLRGLFLRYYLGQRTSSYLPTSTKSELEFSVQYTLTNFIEMNKLWVRYQHDGLSKYFDRRAEERKQLQTVVGSAILRLAQLDAIDLALFSNKILPSLLNQIVQCRDRLAQEYLLDIIVQVFPAEYHMETLNLFLDKLRVLHPDTSVSTILIASMKRILDYVKLWKEERESIALSQEKESAEIKDISGKDLQVSVKERTETESSSISLDENNDLVDEKKVIKENGPAELSQDNSVKLDLSKSNDVSSSEQPNEATSEKEDPDMKKEISIEETKGLDDKATSNGSPKVEDKQSQTAENNADDKTESHQVNKIIPSNAESNSEVIQSDEKIQEVSVKATFAPIVEEYCAIVSRLNASSSERAVLVNDLLKLSEVCQINLDISELFKYVVSAEVLSQSKETEALIISLVGSQQQLPHVLKLLREYPEILSSQSKETRHSVAENVVNRFLNDTNESPDIDLTKQVLELLALLLKSGEFDVTKLKRFITLLKTDSIESTIELLQLAHHKMRECGSSIVQKTSGILAMEFLQLLREKSKPNEVSQILRFCNRICHDLATVGNLPLSAFRLYVTCGFAADNVGAEEAAYELFVQALTIFEESITDSTQQVTSLAIVIQALHQTSVFTSENFDPLAQRCIQYGQRLLKKPDQCRTLLRASHLYWDNNYADPRRVEETLSKAFRSADSVMDTGTSVELFLDVLDTNLYFLGNDTPTITVDSVNSLLKLIKENLVNAEKDELFDESKSKTSLKGLQARRLRTLKFIKTQEQVFPRFLDLEF